MSEQLKDKCPVCEGYLFSDDDIVYCPVCGAPHHRDCWETIGHCGMEEFHGTEKQYKKEEKSEEKKSLLLCSNCLHPIPEDAKFCPYCGNDNNKEQGEENESFINIKFGGMPTIVRLNNYGGLKKDEEIEGIKVSDIARFISFGSSQLLPKFKKFSLDKKAKSWNWVGFVSPYCHAIFRKMDILAFMYFLLELAAYVFLTPLYNLFLNLNMPVGSNVGNVITELFREPSKYFNPSIVITAIIGILILFGARIFAGFNNDRLYKNHVIQTITKIRGDMNSDDEFEFYKKGGVRPVISFLLFIISTYLPTVLPPYIIEFLLY